MAARIEFLEEIPYFSELSPADQEDFRQYTFEKCFSRNELIIIEGEPSETLYFLASGAVKTFKVSPEGKEQILRILRPGDALNDVAVLDGGPNYASAQAMDPVIVCGILSSDLGILLAGRPTIALKIIRILAERVRQFVSLVEDLSFRDVSSRVAKLLLQYADTEADSQKKMASLTPRLTQYEMAAMIGTAREVVGRSLRFLEAEGIIRIERHRIIIVDYEALKRRSDERLLR